MGIGSAAGLTALSRALHSHAPTIQRRVIFSPWSQTDASPDRSREHCGVMPEHTLKIGKKIRIATIGVAHDYRSGLIPLLIETAGYSIEWTAEVRCDLLIFGPFAARPTKRYRWLPKPVRPAIGAIAKYLEKKRQRPLTLFHTAENIRHDEIPADFSISFDLGVNDPSHLRFPYWMEYIDWSHEGVAGNTNPRFGALLSLPRLMSPLGRDFMNKPRKVALFCSHLREPRKLLYEKVSRVLEVQGFGPYFDSSISSHHNSGFKKKDVLRTFAFNLCPENGLYPGYCTEKIPEAFAADSLPITWVDSNVAADFNPASFINMQQFAWQDFEPALELLRDDRELERCAGEPLIRKQPTLAKAKAYLAEILIQATS